MKLSSFSVARFRSIIDAMSLEFGPLTVLIGQNNEGKSNFLRALELSFAFVENAARRHREQMLNPATIMIASRVPYTWDRDYPVPLRHDDQSGAPCVFSLVFDLDPTDRGDLLSQHTIDSPTLGVEMAVSARDVAMTFQAGDTKLENMRTLVGPLAKFVTERFYFAYIPSIRTEAQTVNIVSDIVRQKLAVARRSPEVIEALEKIRQVEKPIIDGLSDEIGDTLRAFLPDLKAIKIVNSDYDLKPSGTIRILVDDGNETGLEQKGDGIKSLAALASFKYRTPNSKSSFLAVEEPEAHLHSGAVHELRRVLSQIAQDSQVLISTHSPAFVSRESPEKNLIVSQGTVRMARSVAEVREAIGIRASDNLLHADHIIVVEGRCDERLLAKAARSHTTKLAGALDANVIIIEAIRGAGKLGYKIGTLKRELFSFLVVLDNDQAGQAAIKDAIANGELEHSEYALLKVVGLTESEMEDCIKLEVYVAEVENKYGVKFTRGSLPGKGKWSQRMKELFTKQGKFWNDTIEDELKVLVADCATAFDGDILDQQRGSILKNILTILDQKLS